MLLNVLDCIMNVSSYHRYCYSSVLGYSVLLLYIIFIKL